MMEGQQVDLNQLIKTQKYKKRIQKQRHYENKHHHRNEHRDRDRWDEREDRRDRNNRRYRQRSYSEQRRERKQKQNVLQSYAIFATGFVSDISIEDILNLAKGKKILSLKTFLKGSNGNCIDLTKDRNMEVIINFELKQEADQFIKQYTDKQLDGKNVLQFQFRRGFNLQKLKWECKFHEMMNILINYKCKFKQINDKFIPFVIDIIKYIIINVYLIYQMKIYLQQECYNWLVKLKILKAYFISDQAKNNQIGTKNQSYLNVQKVQVCYDDQIYLQNGYLIGILLKEILKGQSLWSQKLLKIRKITVLHSYQNWEIVKQILTYLQFPVQQLQECYDAVEISKILEYLHQLYGPNKNLYKNKKKKYFHVDPFKIKLQQFEYQNCENLLEFTCLLLHKALNVSINECLGLLIQRGKYFKHIILKGANIESQQNNPFQRVILLYRELLSNMDKFSQLLSYEENNFQFFMEIFAHGVLSQSETTAKLACLLLQSVNNPQWFFYGGFDIMSKSNYEFVFNLLLDKFKNQLSSVFNTNLHQRFLDNFQFLSFLAKLVKALPKTMYCKQILDSMPIYYLVDKGLEVFNVEAQQNTEQKIRILSRELIQALFMTFNSKFTQNDRNRSLIAFQNTLSINYSYTETLSLLANLFEVIKTLLIKQEIIVEKYFKIAMKYLSQNLSIHQFVMENMIELYRKLMKSFPLGCFLSSYKILQISQNQDFAALLDVSNDSTLLEDEIVSALRIASTYYMSINGDCYMEIIKNLIKFKQSVNWANFLTTQLIGNWSNIKLPPLTSSNVIKKNSLCRFQAFGIKRKQILKFQEYQKYKTLLDNCCQIKDHEFLKSFQKKVRKKISQIQRQKDRQQYKLYLIKLQKKIHSTIERLPIPTDLILKSLSYSREGLSYQSNFRQTQNLFDSKEKGKKFSLPSLPQGPLQIPTERSNQNQNSQDQQIEVKSKFDEDFNQFLIQDSKNQEKQQISLATSNQNSKKNLLPNIEPISPYMSPRQKQFNKLHHECLLPFTQTQSQNFISGHFLIQQMIQNYQILYIKIFQQENQELFKKITQIYDKGDTFQSFLRQTKLLKYLQFNNAEQIHQKCRSLHINSLDIVKELMVQLGFLIFGFKRNKRVSITSLQSFLKILKQNIPFNEPKTKKYKKQMEFQYKINKKLIQTSFNKDSKSIDNKKIDSTYADCFQILNQIFKKSLNLNLPQPLSRVATKIVQLPIQIQKQLDQNKQLSLLQEILQKQVQQSKNDEQQKSIQPKIENSKLDIQKSLKKLSNLKLRSPPKLQNYQQSQQAQQRKKYITKKMDPLQLKQKLQKRKKQLTVQLTSKAVKNLLNPKQSNKKEESASLSLLSQINSQKQKIAQGTQNQPQQQQNSSKLLKKQ